MTRTRTKATLLLIGLLFCLPLRAWAAADVDDTQFHQALAENIRARVSLSDQERDWLARHELLNIRIGPVPPFHFMDSEPRGISVDYLKVFCIAFDLNCRFVYGIPWNESLARFKRGDGVDLLPTIKRTPQREAYVRFSHDYLNAPWVIFTRSDSHFIGSVTDLEDAHGHVVAVERGFVQQKLMETQYPQVRLLLTDNSQEAIQAVATGQADAYIGNLMTGTYLAEHLGLANIKVAAPAPFGNHNLAFGVRMQLPELQSIIDKALDAFTPQETSAIQNRWLSIKYHGVDWSYIRQLAAVVGVIVLALLTSFAYWNRKLQLEIVQRKSTEQALGQSQQQLAGIVQTADEAIIAIDETQRIVLFNDSAEQIFGYTRDEMLGQPLDALIPTAHRERHTRHVQEFLDGSQQNIGRSARGHLVGLRKDGGEFPMEAGISKQQLDAGTIMTVVLRDVSARELAEQEKEQLHRQLTQAQKMEAIGQLTGGIAHDFNNILASVMGNTELALHTADQLGDDRLIRYLHQIDSSGRRARDLVIKMLAFSRGGQGEHTPLSLHDTVIEALEMMQSLLPSSIQIRYQGDPALPPVKADPVQINQIITNLCINARDAMRGQGHLYVALRRTALTPHECESCHGTFSGEFLELSFSDDGRGIEPGVLQRMFDPFFTTKDIGQGSGMGLSMVHGIVHDHGGHILVKSTPELGTTFRLFFPLQEPAGYEGTRPAEAAPTELIPAPGERHLLLVDDEAPLLDFLSELLIGLGYQVTACTSSSEALGQLASGATFDLLLTDQTMPEHTGLELARKARELHPAMPIIMTSGYSDALGLDPVNEHDIDGFFGKPIDAARLTALMAELLRQPA